MLQKRSYAVEDPECLPDLVLRVVLRELPAHEGQEVGEHDIAGRVRVDLVHHVLKTSTVFVPGLFLFKPPQAAQLLLY